jgi:hypothetical protein
MQLAPRVQRLHMQQPSIVVVPFLITQDKQKPGNVSLDQLRLMCCSFRLRCSSRISWLIAHTFQIMAGSGSPHANKSMSSQGNNVRINYEVSIEIKMQEPSTKTGGSNCGLEG